MGRNGRSEKEERKKCRRWKATPILELQANHVRPYGSHCLRCWPILPSSTEYSVRQQSIANVSNWRWFGDKQPVPILLHAMALRQRGEICAGGSV